MEGFVDDNGFNSTLSVIVPIGDCFPTAPICPPPSTLTNTRNF